MRKADNLPPYRAVVMKSGSLNFLEPSGPARPFYAYLLGWVIIGASITAFFPTKIDLRLPEKRFGFLLFPFLGPDCDFGWYTGNSGLCFLVDCTTFLAGHHFIRNSRFS